jgi:hypothetical protein
VSSKTFNRLAKSLKTSQQSTSKCWKIKISINIKEEQKAPSETMLQLDNRLVIARKQVSPRTNVEEFINQGQGLTPMLVFSATIHVGGTSEKKIFSTPIFSESSKLIRLILESKVSPFLGFPAPRRERNLSSRFLLTCLLT